MSHSEFNNYDTYSELLSVHKHPIIETETLGDFSTKLSKEIEKFSTDTEKITSIIIRGRQGSGKTTIIANTVANSNISAIFFTHLSFLKQNLLTDKEIATKISESVFNSDSGKKIIVFDNIERLLLNNPLVFNVIRDIFDLKAIGTMFNRRKLLIFSSSLTEHNPSSFFMQSKEMIAEFPIDTEMTIPFLWKKDILKIVENQVKNSEISGLIDFDYEKFETEFTKVTNPKHYPTVEKVLKSIKKSFSFKDPSLALVDLLTSLGNSL
jgi:hypothetical protein